MVKLKIHKLRCWSIITSVVMLIGIVIVQRGWSESGDDCVESGTPVVLRLVADCGKTYKYGQEITVEMQDPDFSSSVSQKIILPGSSVDGTEKSYEFTGSAYVEYCVKVTEDFNLPVEGTYDAVLLTITMKVPTPTPAPTVTPETTATPVPTATPIPTATLAPTPCPPYPPDSTEVISLTWTDESSITIPLPLIDDLEIPLDWTIEGSATFEINNTNPSIKIPDEIEITSGNINIGASLPAVVVSVSVSAKSSAELINAEFFASACGDGGVMAKFKADAEARIEITLNVSLLFWGTDVYTWELTGGDNVPITIKSACVYCPKGGNE